MKRTLFEEWQKPMSKRDQESKRLTKKSTRKSYGQAQSLWKFTSIDRNSFLVMTEKCSTGN